jgi:hypothetical protein
MYDKLKKKANELGLNSCVEKTKAMVQNRRGGGEKKK